MMGPNSCVQLSENKPFKYYFIRQKIIKPQLKKSQPTDSAWQNSSSAKIQKRKKKCLGLKNE